MLSIFRQVFYKLHTSFTSETCMYLIQVTYVASDWGIVHACAHHHTPKKATTHSHYFTLPPNHGRCPPPSSLGDKRIKICYKDDGDSGKVWRRCRGIRGAGDERQRQCAAVAIAQLMAAAREAVDDGAGAIVPYSKRGRERHSPRRTGGHRCRMPVQDGAMGEREGGEGATATGGGGERG